MKYNYILIARGNYFKFIISSWEDKTGIETYVGMYDLPIKQCYARGIYVVENGDILQRGLVFLCAFPGKTFNLLETTTTLNPDGEPIEYSNDFFINEQPLSMHGFFEELLSLTAQ